MIRIPLVASKVIPRFTMIISDNGKGFDLEAVKGGSGLKNMKMRAARIGAKLLISASEGTLIELRMNGI